MRRGHGAQSRFPGTGWLAWMLLFAAAIPGLLGTSRAAGGGEPVFNPANGHWYQPVVDRQIWADANTAAQGWVFEGMRGHLATLTSAAEQEFLTTNLPEALAGYYYLGGFQPAGSEEGGGGWMWVTGEPWSYTHWASGQPDNAFGEDDRLCLTPGSGWNDCYYWDTRPGYVVEYEPDPHTSPGLPGDLRAVGLASDGIALRWIDASFNETGFEVERRTEASEFARVAVLEAGTTEYWDFGRQPGVLYTYRLRATNADGDSPYSNEAVSTAATTVVAQNPDNGHWYEGIVCGGSIPWQTARAAAESFSREGLGGHLVTISSEAENRFVATHFGDAVAQRAWMGGFQLPDSPEPDGGWVWVTDEPWDYTAWAGGQPSDTAGEERWLHYWTGDGGWNDIARNSFLVTAFIVEYDDLASALRAPSGLSATAVAQNAIHLAWSDSNEDEDGFRIERGSGADPEYAEIGTAPAGARDFDDSGLEPDTEYTYRVRAYRGTDTSPYSQPTSARTLPPPPGAPAGLTATARSQTRIDLAWEDRSTSEQRFEIERKVDDGVYAPRATVGEGLVAYEDTVEADHAYTYRVRAANLGGASEFSNEAGARTFLPRKPLDLKATPVSSSRIDLAWKDDSSDETGFEIQRRRGGEAYRLAGTVADGITEFCVEGLLPSSQYTFQVRAQGPIGPSEWSNEASASTLGNGPAAPSDLTAEAIAGLRVRLTWVDNGEDEEEFQIERRTEGTEFTSLASVGPNSVVFTDSDLQPVTRYYYRVRAANTGGFSAYTNVADAATLVAPPAEPSGLRISQVGETSLQLTWRDESANETGFRIERSQAAADFAELSVTAANAQSYADSGLTANTLYSYRIRATNAGGDSPYTAEVTARTLPAAPSAFAVEARLRDRLDLKWTDTNVAPAAHRLERLGADGITFQLVAEVRAGLTSYADGGLAARTTYGYRLRAQNSTGASDWVTLEARTTVPPPGAPTGLRARAEGTTRIALTWAAADNIEDGFEVERKEDGGAFSRIGTTGHREVTFADGAVRTGRRYTYRVRAFNEDGRSAYSDPAAVTLAGAGQLVVTDRLSFGSVRVGKRAARRLVVRNGSREWPLEVRIGKVTGPFRLLSGGGRVTLGAGKERVLRLEFRPAKRGAARGSLRITSSDPDRQEVEVRLSGRGK
jgi:hypothetical protein